MFLKPQVPENPTLTAATHSTTAGLTHQPKAPACSCHHTPGGPAQPAPPHRALPTVSTGAIAVVLVGGVVLTALLTAVAVSAISVAVAAVVLRSLLRSQQRHR
ncbi:SpdD protein [Streptomyces odontomachi]|uniref:SpdD protein n=1 Tax=Streptomyces odontomachi TaxID=2944940 RepID=UPI00210A09B2|nr:SpdD protein [Streptomyces sp. ODS25]